MTGTPESWTEAPVLYKQTLVNIQAIVRSPYPLSHSVAGHLGDKEKELMTDVFNLRFVTHLSYHPWSFIL
jgi:hypothetical protein